jgi:hypothetical protein
MFQKALRAGLPISGEALGKNLQDCGLPPQIGDHKLDLEVERRVLASVLPEGLRPSDSRHARSRRRVSCHQQHQAGARKGSRRFY